MMAKPRSKDARRIALLRRAQTAANAKHGIGGRPKKQAPKPVSLATVAFSTDGQPKSGGKCDD